AFIGTRYHGFQIQKNAVTVQAVFQDALRRVLGGLPDIKGCSRTDAGVHAREYCLSFRTCSEIVNDRMRDALNFHLPRDIRVMSVSEAPDGFHARYSCLAKRYRYLVVNSRVMDPFYEGLALQFVPHIDSRELHSAAQRFVGAHDFLPFSGCRRGAEDTVREVFEVSVTRENDVVCLLFTADGFLYNMARVMTGTLLSVARGALVPEDIDAAFASGERKTGCFTAPAGGLYLDKVYYEYEAGEKTEGP
ncbi:MAG: tRNA pseudouridine(38-40) synthase TruA, partial [Oscillospiraceae bacterium]|nr:tRNA pseudouridine(38-40) synthase TruA [Oscillospiraceae bacterium]